MRLGHGYDLHRLTAGEGLVLAGEWIACDYAIVAHSDGDVILHAVCDAIFGALALGDIGQHFPPSDAAYKNADSRDLLRGVVALLKAKNYSVNNIDATVICEAPKLSPHTAQMCINIAADCNVEVSQINIKATTTEKLGFTGRGEGIAAEAVCTIK